MTPLETLERRVREAHALSGQGSYERRAPSAESRALFVVLRRELCQVAAGEPSADAWRLLASVEEGLLAYPSALASLQKAFGLGLARDRAALKWLARLQECARKWQGLALTPDELEALGGHLEEALAERGCDHGTTATEAWLRTHKPRHVRPVLNALQELGGYCDCEILANVVEG